MTHQATDAAAIADESSWPEDIYGLLKRYDVRQVAFVPDGGHAALIRRVQGDPDIRGVALTTEEEGVAMLAGAWLGGQRGVLLMQSSGVGNCINMLSLVKACRWSPTYDLAAAGDHDRNFYLWGAMGGAATVGLGLALARPEVPVAVIAGDGEALMGIGGLATIAVQRPANLSIVVLDNGLYGETGGQPSHTGAGVDLAGVAAACGIADCRVVETMDGVAALAAQIATVGTGPAVAAVRIDGEEQPRCLPSRDGVALKARLRAAFGLPSM